MRKVVKLKSFFRIKNMFISRPSQNLYIRRFIINNNKTVITVKIRDFIRVKSYINCGWVITFNVSTRSA